MEGFVLLNAYMLFMIVCRCEYNLFTLFFVAELMMNGVLDFFLRLRSSCAQWGQGIFSCRH